MKQLTGFINTPCLWSQRQFGLEQFKMPTFALDDGSEFFTKPNLRLGHQIEYIFLQLVKKHPEYKILAHNVQIKRGNKTIGELDFLLEHHNTIYHIELSYKFYIIDPTITEPIHRLIGPNRKDMFFTKLEKTKNKQLPLLHSKDCSPYLKELDIDPSQVKQQVCFLSQLFLPITGEIPSIRPLNKQCITGSWMKMRDFEEVSFRESVYYIPTKSEWIHQPHSNVTWQNHLETLMEVNMRHIKEQAPMLWRKMPDGRIDKFFVVWW